LLGCHLGGGNRGYLRGGGGGGGGLLSFGPSNVLLPHALGLCLGGGSGGGGGCTDLLRCPLRRLPLLARTLLRLHRSLPSRLRSSSLRGGQRRDGSFDALGLLPLCCESGGERQALGRHRCAVDQGPAGIACHVIDAHLDPSFL
jgi:hypothetical protein